MHEPQTAYDTQNVLIYIALRVCLALSPMLIAKKDETICITNNLERGRAIQTSRSVGSALKADV
jgi:hypothetical protein